ncbi:MAG: alpha/beta hydrolase [Myxococcota bacterium]
MRPAVVGRIEGLRRRAGAMVVDNLFRGLSAAGRIHPRARAELRRVRVLSDVAYVAGGGANHRLDVYVPTARPGPWPVVLYVHGGGFRILSKETHWLMALAFARRGWLVFNINYRLAPRHPFPAAIEDACAALRWVWRHATAYGGDPSRLVLAGESAGANLVSALSIACCWRRPEPWACALFDDAITPRAVLPACGLLQVSDTARLGRDRKLPWWLADRLTEVSDAYLGAAAQGAGTPRRVGCGSLDLADPLLVFERGQPPDRPLPPFFAAVGTRDPLLDDTRRLARALERLGGTCEARYYDGEPHAFHALVFRRNARRCWRDAFAFLDRYVAT